MILELPFNNISNDFEYSIELERVVYTFRFKFNERSNRWSMSISDAQGEPILSGVVLVTTWGLIKRFANTELPPGEIFVYDSTGKGEEPSRDSIGTTHSLVYIEIGTDLSEAV